MPEAGLCIFFLFLLLFLVCSRGCERSLFRNVDCGALRERWGPAAENKDEDRGARCLECGSTDARVKSSFVNLTMRFFIAALLLLLFIIARRTLLLYSLLKRNEYYKTSC